MFGRYLLFEIKRQCTSIKTIVVTLAFFLGLAGFLVYNAYMHRDAHERRIETFRVTENELVNLAERIRAEQRHEDLVGFTVRTAEESAALLTMINEDVRRVSAQRIHSDLDRPDMEPAWERVLEATVARHERLLVNFYAWRSVQAVEQGISATDIDFNDPSMENWYRIRYTEASLMKSIQFYRYLQNAGIPPIYSPYDPTAFQLLHRIIATLGVFILPFLVILISADIFSKEGDSSGYKILLLQPLSRAKIYIAKLISGFSVCFASLFLPLLLLFCIAGIVFGFGLGGYPVPFAPAQMQLASPYETSVEVLARLNPYEAMPNGFVAIASYLMLILPFISLYVLFMVSLTVFISMLARDSVFALAASLGVALASLVLMEFVWGVALWNPIAYADINHIITSGFAGFYWYPALWAMVLITAGILWFRKKDIVC